MLHSKSLGTLRFLLFLLIFDNAESLGALCALARLLICIGCRQVCGEVYGGNLIFSFLFGGSSVNRFVGERSGFSGILCRLDRFCSLLFGGRWRGVRRFSGLSRFYRLCSSSRDFVVAVVNLILSLDRRGYRVSAQRNGGKIRIGWWFTFGLVVLLKARD